MKLHTIINVMKVFLKNHRILYVLAKVVRFVFHFFYAIFIILISFFEVLLFFITHPRIFKNDLLFVFWHWSFGHSIYALDYASRLYYPHRISVIYLPHAGSNEYLPLCFSHNMDVFIYKSIIPTGKDHLVNAIRCFLLRIPLLVMSGLWKKFYVLEHSALYKTLSRTNTTFFAGNETQDRLEKYTNITGYMYLITHCFGKKPHMPEYLEKKCRQEIEAKYPDFFKKRFITLLLRRKGGEEDFETIVRCSGPQENYVRAIRYIIESGYYIVGTGETRHECFEDISGYFSFKNVNLPPQLLNLFLLINCALFIGQHSGPYVLINSCGIPILLCDSFPYRIGTFNKEDIVLFKHFRERMTEKRLSLIDVFTKHVDLAYGYGFARKKIAVENNSSEEILEAVKESLERLEGRAYLTEEEKKLAEKFRSLIPKDMLIAYEGNRPPRSVLYKLKNELLSL